MKVRRLAVLTIVAALGGFFGAGCTFGGSVSDQDMADFDQSGALADGKVSDAEYRLAKSAELRCLEERGWEVTGLMDSPDGVTLFYNIATPDDRDPSSDSAECAALFSQTVESAYIEQHKLTGAEQEAGLDALFQCFADIPVEGVLRSDSSKQLLFKASEQYPDPNSPEFDAALDCMETHQWAITDQDIPE